MNTYLPSQPLNGSSAGLIICDQARTAELLDFKSMVDAVGAAAIEYDSGEILSPERMVVTMGTGGVLLSMPATANDIGIHKLVNVQPANAKRHLPTIHGMVTVCDAVTGKLLCLLDGPEVTGRRTAAVSLLAIRELHGKSPAEVLLIGSGTQAAYHLQAIAAMYPACKVWVSGLDRAASERFCATHQGIHQNLASCPAQVPESVDVVITLTTSTEPVYNEIPRAGRLVIGVGAFKPEMAEIGKRTLDGSTLYADDPAGARHEAGDLMRAGINWDRVQSMASLLRTPADRTQPVVFKSVGTAAWDLAAARVALKSLGEERARDA